MQPYHSPTAEELEVAVQLTEGGGRSMGEGGQGRHTSFSSDDPLNL